MLSLFKNFMILLVLLLVGCNGAKQFSAEQQGTCQAGQQVIGAHIIFLIDNSGSMEETDCPNVQLSNDAAMCGSITNREVAVLDVWERLEQIQNEDPQSQLAQSFISVSRFTPTTVGEPWNLNDYRPSPPVGTFGDINRQNFQRIQGSMSFTRKPAGDSPYLNGILAAGNLLQASVSADSEVARKQKVIIMVTDGEPTDKNPAEVRMQAEVLKASDVSWYTFLVSKEGDFRRQRLAAHKQLMQQNYLGIYGPSQPEGRWMAERYSNNFDAYFNELVSLADVISDRVVEVAGSASLSQIINEEVISKTDFCQ